MVVERPLGPSSPAYPMRRLSARARARAGALEPCIAADGTMRIPVRATLWRPRGKHGLGAGLDLS